MLIDTHCHLNLDHYSNDLGDVISRARTAGVEKMIIPGVNLETSLQAIHICEQFDGLFAAIGIHPNDIVGSNDSDLEEIRSLARNPKVVAIGEIGLDYFRYRSPKESQIEFFIKQLHLAVEIDLPVIIHSRKSLSDIYQIISDILAPKTPSQKNRPIGVMHSFEGNAVDASWFSTMGFLISINGSITFNNSTDKQALARSHPLDFILLETDAPYMAPSPYRGKRNEPSFIPAIAQKLAELKHCETEEVNYRTTNNANRLFHLSD